MGYCGNAVIIPEPQLLAEKTCFDLASLTKPLATTLAILALVEDGSLALGERLPQLLARKVPDEKAVITLGQLLGHSSGLIGHRPFFREIAKVEKGARSEAMLEALLAEPLVAEPGKKAVYSDLGFLLLGWIVERRSGMRLDAFVHERIYQPLGLEYSLFFRPLEEPPPPEKKFAATEACPWRDRVMYGEVSDENTYVLGGVAGQAGLFGDLESVVHLVSHLLDCWQGRARHPAFSNEALRFFLTRDASIPGSTRTLGFDTPSANDSSAGKFFHPTSIGHLGFTGTSFWIDPTRDLAIVLLSNRVHPDRANEKIKKFRPFFHNGVMESLRL